MPSERPDQVRRAEISVACTLGPVDGRARLERWRELHESAEAVARMVGGELEVRYGSGSGVREELESLASAERSCCSFLEWVVGDEDGRPTLRVIPPQGSPEVIGPIAALFGLVD
jgi:hypothetical protein